MIPFTDRYPAITRGHQDTTAPSSVPRPKPFREFVLKVAARCDLACDYCYMYAMADDGWRTQPRFMSPATVDRIGAAIATHVRRHGLPDIAVMLHGGEPLLAGDTVLARIATSVRAAVPTTTRVRVSVQTNGTRLDEHTLDTLVAAGIRVSVSIDGDAASHDRHRRGPNGDASHERVARAVHLLGESRYRSWFAGLLCVIDLANDPCRVYRALAAFAPPVIDFLLPHGNWSTPPPGRPPDESTPYGHWLVRAFDEWYDSPPDRPEVRLFREIITLLLGGHSHTEQIGLSPAAMVVFNVDGAIEQVDSLRSTYAGAAATGLSVFTAELDEALCQPGVATRQLGLAGLSRRCRDCAVVSVCGGGHYAHRYRAGAGFANPSVYCPDLEYLIRHVRTRIVDDLTRDGWPVA